MPHQRRLEHRTAAMDDPHMNTRQLSSSSREIIYEEFLRYDKHRDGFVTLEEATEVLNSLFGFPPDKTKRMLEKCDRNGDNRLSYDEFVEFYFRVQNKVAEMHSYFHETDKNHDGEVDPSEAHKMMKQLAFNDKEIETMMAISDFTGDGRLKYEEFVRFWK